MRWGIAFIAVLAMAGAGVSRAAEAVGAASALRPQAMQSVARGSASTLSLKSPIYRNAELSTAANGLLEVTFLDDSKLSIGSGSRVVVDSFVYGGNGGAGQQVVKYTKGAFRFISGKIPKEKVQLETPTVTIGIRGTTIRTLVTDDGTTTVGLDHGDAFVTSKQTGQTVFLTPGEKVTIKPSGEVGTITLGKVEGCP